MATMASMVAMVFGVSGCRLGRLAWSSRRLLAREQILPRGWHWRDGRAAFSGWGCPLAPALGFDRDRCAVGAQRPGLGCADSPQVGALKAASIAHPDLSLEP